MAVDRQTFATGQTSPSKVWGYDHQKMVCQQVFGLMGHDLPTLRCFPA